MGIQLENKPKPPHISVGPVQSDYQDPGLTTTNNQDGTSFLDDGGEVAADELVS